MAITPVTLSISGSDLTGSDATRNRTYVIDDTDILDDGMSILINGTPLHVGASNDYTFSDVTITFLNIIDNTDVITLIYFVGPTIESTYATPSDVKRILQLGVDFSTSTTPTRTEVEAFLNKAQDEIELLTKHAWREKTVTKEYYDLGTYYGNRTYGDLTTNGIPISMRHRAIIDFDNGEGDKIEVWNGSSYDDWVTARTEGRASDWWLDNEQGELFIKYFYPFFRIKAIRLTYRYGETTVPKDILDITAMIAAIKVLESDDRSSVISETGDATRLPYDPRIRNWQREIDKVIRNRTELVPI